jgi:hypothetical protein
VGSLLDKSERDISNSGKFDPNSLLFRRSPSPDRTFFPGLCSFEGGFGFESWM